MCRMFAVARRLHPHFSVFGASRSFLTPSPRTTPASSSIWSCSLHLEFCVTVTTEGCPYAPLTGPGWIGRRPVSCLDHLRVDLVRLAKVEGGPVATTAAISIKWLLRVSFLEGWKWCCCLHLAGNLGLVSGLPLWCSFYHLWCQTFFDGASELFQADLPKSIGVKVPLKESFGWLDPNRDTDLENQENFDLNIWAPLSMFLSKDVFSCPWNWPQ